MARYCEFSKEVHLFKEESYENCDKNKNLKHDLSEVSKTFALSRVDLFKPQETSYLKVLTS